MRAPKSSPVAADGIAPPPLALLAMEGCRGMLDHLAGAVAHKHIVQACPRGDGHPVIVYPGMAAGDAATAGLRGFLCDIGYRALPWGQGINLGPRGPLDDWFAHLVTDLHRVADECKEKVSLVGWSLGGVYARELAKVAPHLVRRVITLGTPVHAVGHATSVRKVFERMAEDTRLDDPALQRRLDAPPEVPTASVFSRSDGVVSWKSSCAQGSRCIEVPRVSHLGLVAHPRVKQVVAALLAGF